MQQFLTTWVTNRVSYATWVYDISMVTGARRPDMPPESMRMHTEGRVGMQAGSYHDPLVGVAHVPVYAHMLSRHGLNLLLSRRATAAAIAAKHDATAAQAASAYSATA